MTLNPVKMKLQAV